jgi:protease PrsW
VSAAESAPPPSQQVGTQAGQGVLVRPAPLAARANSYLRVPAFWMVVALLLAGAVRIAALLDGAFIRYPIATIVAIILFTLYVVPLWVLVNALDHLEREPPSLLTTAFGWGALVATPTAVQGSIALHDILAKVVSPRFSAVWGPAIAAPAVEETVKTLGIVAIVLIARGQVNSLLDGVVYGALVGLGFQVVEDIVYAVSAVALAGDGDQAGPVLTAFFLRGFLAGLWSHMLFSALAGAGIGYLVVSTNRPLPRRVGVAAGGLLAAWSCHFLWNSPVLADGFGYGGWGVLAGLVLKGTPPLVMIYFVVRVARDREGDDYAAQLAALDDPLVATPDELRVLGTGRLRAQARRYAYARAGARGRRAVRRLQQAQAALAVALSRASHGGLRGSLGEPAAQGGASAAVSAEVARWRDEVLLQRDRLVSVGHPSAAAPERRGDPWTWPSRVVGTAVVVFAVALVSAAIRSLGGG